ncbi:MAG TPA: ribonuclease D [Alphaproteobacteria bacterium]|nr:ribonuclease D [Alphaproteobacteria bacterium]
MRVITDTAALSDCCNRLAKAEFITVDTEFIRDKTYWPRLCLIQIAGPEDELIVDPLADGIDLAPFYWLMAQESVTKVFHAARQDVEIFFHEGQTIPTPLFDTQVAAMVCGFGDSIGYDNLARKILNVRIDKSSRFSDWARRPLTERQLNYAIQDVTHLRHVYEWLHTKLDENGRSHWLQEEMAILTAPSTYEMHPENAWLRIKARGANRRFLGVLKHVAAWREQAAQDRDIPRNRVLRDEALVEIAGHPPKSIKELGDLRNVPKGVAEGRLGQALLAAILEGVALDEAELPTLPKKPAVTTNNGSLVELMKVLLKRQCEEAGVAPRLVANATDLELIAADDNAPVPALSGWRYELFGQAALNLKHGKLALAANGRKVRLIELDTE